MTEVGRFRELLAGYGPDTAGGNRLTQMMRDQLDEQELRGAVSGRSPPRNPSLAVVSGGDASSVGAAAEPAERVGTGTP